MEFLSKDEIEKEKNAFIATINLTDKSINLDYDYRINRFKDAQTASCFSGWVLRAVIQKNINQS